MVKAMTKTSFAVVARVQRWLSTVVNLRKTMGKKKHVNDLSDHILWDIGWPDSYCERLLTPLKRAEQSHRESSGQYESTNAPNGPGQRAPRSRERVTSLDLQD